ncbi:hypothetical protein Pst134EA_007817 [Puccinia striiformis f. sp. tritici]|uniref:hypothetical protein n=1 Tax=Puccinia striiformis f. sp. tritici TaxID=168172 RepID=UPI0020072212|nr:hypothetical protein Pst134EA_007809 [Puccinia striiformis f. sp. tritici]XP_047810024.1 hypothetical protein Pst134EA_007817 [Puccinia striiformis f. sp. tritici]KAH9470562.1 hypothetical protein Pst134EA_007809 [Puccinia striiformis f. sp. tritici]KAH9470570.1 hypothetical protein Pst134EA_007817 [Puccinia striiformis f. sp. tritici]
MSQPFSFSQISTSNTNNNNNINNDHGTINFDQLPNTDPAAVYSTSTLELGFQPAHLIKFALLLLAFLFIPILSTNNPFPTVGHNSRKSSSRSSHRRRRQARRQMPASYQPPQSVVDAPFIPLPTRRHFRISHVGNRTRKAPGTVVYTNQSSSDSEEYCSEDAHSPEPAQQFRLIFGKRLRGEEEEFKGPSAMKGTRLSTRTQSTHPSLTSSSTFNHKDNNHSQPKTDNQQGKPSTHKRAISFAATTQACTHRISTQIDSSLSFLSCHLK